MLSKNNRLRGYRIPLILKSGRKIKNRTIAYCIVLKGEDSKKETRFACITPKKLSKRAVKRNRTKRLLTEVIRNNIGRVKPGFESLVIAQKLLSTESPRDIEHEIVSLLDKADLLNKKL